jgi:ABC-type polysaccharide/polyol phosphate transport system ATPase subunit
MNKEIVIEAKGIEVSFVIQNHGMGSLKQFLFSLGRKKMFERRKILKGIDLTVYKGDCIGLLGNNGSGKSTLLRTLAGVIPLDKGSVKVNGRLAPMLSLGAGLEPEMSGIENIRLCCTLMGVPQKDIDKSMEAIINFSELGDNIHMQVKRYSSGMMARLAFSMVVATNPDILIVDEALAVGDKGFKNKCMAKMDEFRANGTTILYVSHQFSEVEKLCNRVVWVKDGVIVKEGSVKEIGAEYLEQFKQKF